MQFRGLSIKEFLVGKMALMWGRVLWSEFEVGEAGRVSLAQLEMLFLLPSVSRSRLHGNEKILP